MFRAVAARGKYLGQGRMDMQFAAKEVSRFTSKPEEQDWSSAKPLARYLKDNRRVVIEHKYQKLPEKVILGSDTDFVVAGLTSVPSLPPLGDLAATA